MFKNMDLRVQQNEGLGYAKMECKNMRKQSLFCGRSLEKMLRNDDVKVNDDDDDDG